MISVSPKSGSRVAIRKKTKMKPRMKRFSSIARAFAAAPGMLAVSGK
jgi:hypothetical protein